VKAKVLKAENISPTAKLFTLEVVSGEFSFVPGQYTSFLVNGAIRTYSICSLPEELPRFELCVRQLHTGVGTNFLNQNVGREIELTQPAGDFVIGGSPSPILFLVSGTGIAPVRPMLKDYLQKNPEADIELYYTFKGEKEFLFREELEEMERKYGNFKVATSLSRVPSLASLRRGGRDISPRQGRRGELVHLVGSPAFVGQTLQELNELGYNRQVIKTDAWE